MGHHLVQVSNVYIRIPNWGSVLRAQGMDYIYIYMYYPEYGPWACWTPDLESM